MQRKKKVIKESTPKTLLRSKLVVFKLCLSFSVLFDCRVQHCVGCQRKSRLLRVWPFCLNRMRTTFTMVRTFGTTPPDSSQSALGLWCQTPSSSLSPCGFHKDKKDCLVVSTFRDGFFLISFTERRQYLGYAKLILKKCDW